MMGKQKPADEKAIESKLLALITEQNALERKAAELRADDPQAKIAKLNAERAALEDEFRNSRTRREQQGQARRIRDVAARLGTEVVIFAEAGATSSERAAIG